MSDNLDIEGDRPNITKHQGMIHSYYLSTDITKKTLNKVIYLVQILRASKNVGPPRLINMDIGIYEQ